MTTSGTGSIFFCRGGLTYIFNPLPASELGITHESLCLGGGFLRLVTPEEVEDALDRDGDRVSRVVDGSSLQA